MKNLRMYRIVFLERLYIDVIVFSDLNRIHLHQLMLFHHLRMLNQ